MMYGAGARYVRILVYWAAVAPATPPSGSAASDPTSPGYSRTALDSTLEAANSAGLTPILDIVDAPQWAFEKLPAGVNGGTPKASDLGAFATALATHYDGFATGAPAEHVFEVWNEPNLSLDLNPVNGSAYRDMVNAVSDAVHARRSGEPRRGGRPRSVRPPQGQEAEVVLGRSAGLHAVDAVPLEGCTSSRDVPQRATRFDVWSHHPYTFGGPFGKAKLPDDVELGYLPRMRALLQAGERLHHVVSTHPGAVPGLRSSAGIRTPLGRMRHPLSLAARWTAESLHEMWLSGVTLVTWFLLEDDPSPSPYQSGLYFHASSPADARAKPSLTAYRFPFVAYLGKKNTVSVWGRDATSDKETVTIQLRHGKSASWRTVALISSNANGIFKATLKLKATKKDWLRASAEGSGNSLAFSLTPPQGSEHRPLGQLRPGRKSFRKDRRGAVEIACTLPRCGSR